MAYNAEIQLGKILKVYGNDGSVTVKLERQFVENIPEMESVFLITQGRPVPFFISETIYNGGDTAVVRFDGYDSIEKVREFCGCSLFLTSEGSGEEDDKASATRITGFTVMRPDRSIAGTVSSVIENPAQWLLVVISPEGKEILIPFHEDLIRKVNIRTRIIVMDIPEGLDVIND
mgnify:CR=1 FL=1